MSGGVWGGVSSFARRFKFSPPTAEVAWRGRNERAGEQLMHRKTLLECDSHFAARNHMTVEGWLHDRWLQMTFLEEEFFLRFPPGRPV